MITAYGRRDNFYERCTCEFETETKECICTRKLTPPRVMCDRCMVGRHLLRLKGDDSPIEALRILKALW